MGELHGRDRQAVAVGHHRRLNRLPDTEIRQTADPLAWKAQPGVLPQPDLLQGRIELLATDIEGDTGDADVAGFLDHPGDIQHTVVVHVAHGLAPHLVITRAGIDDGFRLVLARVQAHGHDKRLDRRARLKHVDHGAVAHHRRVEVAPVVRVVGRLIGHRQHFAGLYIDHHQAAGLGTEFDQRVAQLAVRQVLQAQVDGQRQTLARLGVLGDLQIADQVAATILEHLTLTRHTGEPVFVGQLDAFTALVVDVGKADHVSRHFTGRVETTKFLDGIHPGNLQIGNRLALLWREPAHQVHELAFAVQLDALSQRGRLYAQRGGQLRPALFGAQQFLGIGPQGGHGSGDGQRLAIAIGDEAAMRRNRDMPQAACITLILEKLLIEHVQVDDPPADRRDHGREQRQHQAEAPGIECAVETAHGATICTSAGSGMRICSCPVASASMRLCAVQVLCSRSRRPHSACALSRTLSSANRALSSWRFQCAV